MVFAGTAYLTTGWEILPFVQNDTDLQSCAMKRPKCRIEKLVIPSLARDLPAKRNCPSKTKMGDPSQAQDDMVFAFFVNTTAYLTSTPEILSDGQNDKT